MPRPVTGGGARLRPGLADREDACSCAAGGARARDTTLTPRARAVALPDPVRQVRRPAYLEAHVKDFLPRALADACGRDVVVSPAANRRGSGRQRVLEALLGRATPPAWGELAGGHGVADERTACGTALAGRRRRHRPATRACADRLPRARSARGPLCRRRGSDGPRGARNGGRDPGPGTFAGCCSTHRPPAGPRGSPISTRTGWCSRPSIPTRLGMAVGT
jgi:hypothetical protein